MEKPVIFLVYAFLTVALGAIPGLAFADLPDSRPAGSCDAHLARVAPTLDSAGLLDAVSGRVAAVEEFRHLRELCLQNGVRCWLFGGTAAGFAHYVKWQQLHERGDARFQKERFDYDYTHIYRSTQDADLVIDGPEEAARRIEEALKERFPHFQGSKSVWEIRLLGKSHGDKEALLDNPDFLGQHTDSNSTGMIEVTNPPEGEPVIRDIRDWKAHEQGRIPAFFEDVLQGKLHYYFSDTHGETSRAKKGLNPPILSVIRYLTKAFQYELEMRPDDFERLRKIVEGFDAKDYPRDSYVMGWLSKNGKKLVQHAVNIEYAMDTLDRIGLRDKLKDVGSVTEVDSLAWWIQREPLRTKPVGQGAGRTAADLGLRVVSHETQDFLAYESITRAHTGEPNVLVSREGIHGETAAHGNGFYTASGMSGARGTRITIRFEVSPLAREGWDFYLAKPGDPVIDGSFVIFLNKAALRVIPESIDLSPLGYFEALASGSDVQTQDRGVLFKLKRRLTHKVHVLSEADQKAIVEIVRGDFLQKRNRSAAWSEFMKLSETNPLPVFAGARRVMTLEFFRWVLDREGADWFVPLSGRMSFQLPRDEEIDALRFAMGAKLAREIRGIDRKQFIWLDGVGTHVLLADEAFDDLLAILADPGTDGDLRTSLMYLLFNHASEARYPRVEEILIRYATDASHWRVQMGALRLLRFKGSLDERVSEAFFAALETRTSSVANEALQGLQAFSLPPEKLFGPMIRIIWEFRRHTGSEQSPAHYASDILAGHDIRDRRTIHQLIGFLDDYGSDYPASLALGGSSNPEVIGALLRRLREPEDKGMAKFYALETLGKLKHEDLSILADLEALLYDDRFKSKGRVLRTIVEIGGGDWRVVRIFGRSTRSRDLYVASEAAMMRLKDDPRDRETYGLLAVALDWADRNIRDERKRFWPNRRKIDRWESILKEARKFFPEVADALGEVDPVGRAKFEQAFDPLSTSETRWKEVRDHFLSPWKVRRSWFRSFFSK